MAEPDSINEYFLLQRRIKSSRVRLAELDRLFFSQTMSSYVTENGMQLISQGFDIQRNCNEHLDVKADIEQKIKLSEFKQRHFSRYLQTLTKEQRLFLKMKYVLHRDQLENEHIERECLLEIDEIEQAARYRFNLKDPDQERKEQQEAARMTFFKAFERAKALIG